MDFEDIMIIEINQIKTNIVWLYLYTESKKKNNSNPDTQKRLVVARGRQAGKGFWKETSKGTNFCCDCCSVTQSFLTPSDPMDCSTPGFLVLHHLPELVQTHVHCLSDAIQPSHLLSSPSPPAFNLSQHQGLFKWVSPSHQVAKVLELQPQHQSLQWIFKIDFL